MTEPTESDLAAAREIEQLLFTAQSWVVDDLAAIIAKHHAGERERIARVEHILGNLLAVIHRDGGHYVAEYGLKSAGRDAEAIVVSMMGLLEECEGHIAGEIGERITAAIHKTKRN